jgi:hypothetical protein
MTISNKSFLVIDRGLAVAQARKLGEKAKKVWYLFEDSNLYLESPKSQIGKGFDEIERVNNLWDYIDKVDCIAFFDSYNGPMQKGLRDKGYNVFGCGMAEELELDRVFFLEKLAELELEVPFTYRAEGIQDAFDYLKGKKDKWLKTSRYRGDFETYHFVSMKHAQSWFDDLRYRIGSRSEEIEILVQDPIDSDCEAGKDDFNILGKRPKKGIVGYEVKDKGYIGKVVDALPPVMKKIDDAFAPFFKEYGCMGQYSNELRITKSGKVHFTDPTLRAPSPPGEAMLEVYSNYAEAIDEISQGKIPELKEKGQYLAQIVMRSDWHDKHDLYVEFPKEMEQWVKLKNVTKKRDGHHCIPNNNGGYFGSVVAYGKTVKEAQKLAIDRANQVRADEFHFDESIFDKAHEAIESGKRHGIGF